jgi:16S rRNA (uracil1498-N3)-methyltransferase
VFRALLPGGGPVLVRVIATDGGTLRGTIEAAPETIPPGTLPGSAAGPGRARLVLFQALPQGAKMDLIVRQATEAGVAEIYPFESARSAARRGDADGKLARWERIVKEARQQSGSAVDTRVFQPGSPEAIFAVWERIKTDCPAPLGIMLHPAGNGGSGPLAQGAFHGYLDSDPGAVVVAIGPEGGFSPAEVDRFLAADFKPLSLGDTVLRTETAALYAAAAVRVILWERSSWILKAEKTAPDRAAGEQER